MDGLMMEYPLTLFHLIERAKQIFPNVEIVSRLPDKSMVRVGHTFHRIVYLPNWRSNVMSDKQYYERLDQQQGNVRRKKVNDPQAP